MDNLRQPEEMPVIKSQNYNLLSSVLEGFPLSLGLMKKDNHALRNKLCINNRRF
jgi:hypothetical protein